MLDMKVLQHKRENQVHQISTMTRWGFPLTAREMLRGLLLRTTFCAHLVSKTRSYAVLPVGSKGLPGAQSTLSAYRFKKTRAGVRE